jgi:hypothetical protein
MKPPKYEYYKLMGIAMQNPNETKTNREVTVER